MYLVKGCVLLILSGCSYCAVVQIAEDQADVECSRGHWKCLTTKKCIPLSWRCDSATDCGEGDQSDEVNCSPISCAKGEYSCPGSGQCIPERWKCDGDVDCGPNGEDEDPKICSDFTRSCETGSLVCSDVCVSPKWICDGQVDCPDGLDEKNCTKTCGADMYTCADGQCISTSWVCDGDHDCLDKSDEIKCGARVCDIDQFKCNVSSRCIDVKWRCDGDLDCPDHSDETNCPLTTHKSEVCLLKTEFQCKTSLECIHKSWQCDGDSDCTDLSDEGADCEIPCRNYECPDNSHCESDAYANKSIAAKCICDRGFEWIEEAGYCKDIDECQHRDTCSQICINTKGGHQCECQPGYTLEEHYHCRANGEPVWLYYANSRDIRRLRTDSRYSEILVEDTKRSIALDFDYEEGLMFWTDVSLQMMMRAQVDEIAAPATEIKPVIFDNYDGGTFLANGLAVDWLYKNIYWTDTGFNKIKVSNYDGSKVKTLIDSGLDEPRAICVDPENGYVYWTDWGQDPKIERNGMDGNKREKIVYGSEHLEWPNGLTIDYVGKRIYWIDSRLHLIGTATLDGSDKDHVLVDTTKVQHPFSITVFEDYLYWTDWSSNSIKTVHKETGMDYKTLSTGLYAAMDIKVCHELRQERRFKDQATKLCETAQCEFLCLPAARVASNATVSCVCADGQTLNFDKRTCTTSQVTDRSPLTSLKPVLITNTRWTITTMPFATTKNAVAAVKPSTTLKAEANTIEGKATNTEGITTATESVTTNTEGITTATEGITTTTQGVTTATEGVTTNTEGVITNTEGVTTKTEGVTTKTEGVTTKTEGVTTATEGVTTNTEGVTTTTEGVTTATEGVTTATEGVTTATEGVTTATEGVTTATEGVTTATEGVTTATEGVTTNTEGVTTATEGVTTAIEGVTTATEGVTTATEGVTTATEGVTTATEGVTTNTEGVTTATEGVTTATEGVTTNTEGVTTNTEGVTTATEGVTTATEGVTTATEGVTTNTEGVTTNTEGVTTATEGVTTNTEGVTTTTEGVTNATEGVTTNTESVTTATEGVTTATEGVPTATEGVTTATEGVTTATESVTTNTEGVTTATEGVTTATEGVTTATEGVTTNTEGVTTNTEGVTTSVKSSIQAPFITGEERVDSSEIRQEGKSKTALQLQLLQTIIYRSLLEKRKLELEMDILEEKRNQSLSLFEQRRRNGQALFKAKLMLLNLKMENERKKLKKEDIST